MCSSDLRATLKALKGRVQLRFRDTWQGNPAAFSTLIDAIASSRCVDMEYRSFKAELAALSAPPPAAPGPAVSGKARKKVGGKAKPEMKQYEVHGVYFAKRSLYAVVREFGKGTPGEPDALFSVRFDRIKQVEPTEQPFVAIPKFDVDKYMAPAWEAYRSSPPKPTTVTIRVDPEVNVNIKTTEWHHSQKGPIEEVDAAGKKTGKFLYTFKVDGFSEICYWIASLGPGAEAIRPKAFRGFMKDLVERMRARYGT